MIQSLNKLLKPSLRAKKKSMEGQIAVILVLFLAVLLVVLSVVMNLGKIAQKKTLLQVVSDTSAIAMASLIASVAETQFQECFRGKYEHNSGGFERPAAMTLKGEGWFKKMLTAIIDLVVAAGLTVISCVPGGQWAAPLAGPAWVNFAGSVADMGLSMHVQDKAIRAWNRMFEGLEQNEQLRQQGLTAAIGGVAMDPVLLPDDGDYDMNGYYVGDGTDQGEKEKVGRFSVLNSKRVVALAEKQYDYSPVMKNFRRALAEFVFEGGGTFNLETVPIPDDDWGLWDKGNASIPGACPATGYYHNECDVTCDASKNPLDPNCPSNNSDPWRYIYDKTWESFSNTSFESFREFIGRDDESKKFFINGSAQLVNPGNWYPFDATGLYKLLWDINTLKMPDANVPQGYAQTDLQKCFWTGMHTNGGNIKTSDSCQYFFDVYTTYPKFVLPRGMHCEHPQYENFHPREACWSSYYFPTSNPAFSKKLDPVGLELPLIDDAMCYQSDYPVFSWKKGTSRYCSTGTLPYNICPGKNCDASCASCSASSATCKPDDVCGGDGQGGAAANQGEWRNDAVELFRYGYGQKIDDFINFADSEIFMYSPEWLLKTFDSWYPYVEQWIRVGDPANPGGLEQWIASIENIEQVLSTFKNKNFVDPSGNALCTGTAGDLEFCYDSTLEQIDYCLNACLGNVPICEQLKGRLDLFFQEPPPTSGLYAGQATGCDGDPAGTKAYNFKFELENWQAKILYRKQYLFGINGWGGIFRRVDQALEKLQTAKDKINGFLNDPRVKALRNFDPNAGSGSAGGNGQVIYAWRDKPKPGYENGPWRVVLAETKIPTLCNNNCRRTTCVADNDGVSIPSTNTAAYNANCPREPRIPKILSDEFETAPYYFLVDYDGYGTCTHQNDTLGANYKYPSRCFKGGLTKARVIRYDQEIGRASCRERV